MKNQYIDFALIDSQWTKATIDLEKSRLFNRSFISISSGNIQHERIASKKGN